MTNNADEFLQYVAQNTPRLKKNLRKNITMDYELFEDIFSDTIVKCYDSICRKNLIVEDFERFFFIAGKFNYIQAQNKKRKLQSRRIDIEEYKETEIPEFDFEEEKPEVPVKYSEMENAITEYFGEKRKRLFLEYFNCRLADKLDLQELADKYNYTPEIVNAEIKSIKQFLKEKNANKYIKSVPLF